MPTDPQRNARLQAKINFPISGKCRFFLLLANTLKDWDVPENIHTPPTEISAVRRGRREKIVSDNSKCIRTSEGGRGVNFLFPP